MENSLLPGAYANVGSVTNLVGSAASPAFVEPGANQPPVWTRDQGTPATNTPGVPAIPPTLGAPPMTGFVPQPPTWTRPMPSMPVPMAATSTGQVSIDMGTYAAAGLGGVQPAGGAGAAGFADMTGATGAAAATGVGEVAIPMDPRGQIQSMLTGYFAPYVNDANRAAFEALVDRRTEVLSDMGHTPERILANVDKANRFDWASVLATGAVNSLSFAAATVAIDAQPALTAPAGGSPAGIGLLAGVESAVVDNAGMALLNAGTSNARWLKPASPLLEDVMRQAVQDNAPAFWEQAVRTAAAFQTYTGRNLVRTAAVPVVYAIGGKAAKSIADTTLAAAGGPVAGAGAYAVMRQFDKMNGQEGPALFFGQRNWEDLYDQLDSATWRSHLMNGGVRVARFPLDVITGSAGAVQNLFKPAQLAQTGVLGGGFAGVAAATSAAASAMQQAGYGPVATELVKQGVNTLASAPVFAAWTTAALGAGPAADAVAERIQGIGRRPQTRSPAAAAGHAGHQEIEMREATRSLIDPALGNV